MVVADAGPLIAFARIRRLELLPGVLGEVLVPEAVASECLADAARAGATAIQAALDRSLILRVPNPIGVAPWDDILGAGESSAIRLAMEVSAAVLMDEKRGRRLAQAHGLSVIGSAGVMLSAKARGMIQEVAPMLEAFRSHGYFLSDALVRAILLRAGE